MPAEDTTVNCDKCGRLLPAVEGFEGDYTCDFCVTYAALEEELPEEYRDGR